MPSNIITLRKIRFIQHRRWIIWSCCLCFVLNAYQCTDAPGKAAIPAETTGISQDGSWSERMAESVMKRNPKAWQLEERLVIVRFWPSDGCRQVFTMLLFGMSPGWEVRGL